MKMMEIEVWVCVNEGEDYSVGIDEELAAEGMDEHGGTMRRMICVKLTVPVPSVSVLLGTVPVEGDATLVV